MAEESKPGEIFEMFQKMINPMAFPMQNLMMAGLSPEEIDKKLGELNTVKHWLNTHLGMLDLTIKALEYQRALLTPAPAGSEKQPAAGGPGADNPFFNPALWPWNFMAGQEGGSAAPAATPQKKPGPDKRPG
ncbi:MAG: hypothetical protein KGI47_05205 [Betaproteobacteria bacterium]|nr:hypothetical protein [Betaproteobacteria bacterium]MDE2622163.1 hypothetical protein [Betaproteobacteria bacterium]